MTCYLAQSLVWSVVFTPFLLDLSDTLTVASTALLAIATWMATVVLADWMRRTGRRGPFEVLVRRVTYRQLRGRESVRVVAPERLLVRWRLPVPSAYAPHEGGGDRPWTRIPSLRRRARLWWDAPKSSRSW